MSEANEQTTYKRKRKKSFLQNARKYAKKGHYGRGSHIDADTYQYFVRVMEVYREGFPSEEEKLIFVNNVFDQTENSEIECCCNQVGCRVVETLLPFASDQVLLRIAVKIGEDLRRLCGDRFASHVIEALVTECCKRSLKSEDEDVREKLRGFTLKVAKFLLNNLEDFVWDVYGSHIIRSVLLNLANVGKEEGVKVTEEVELCSDYVEIVKEYGERLLSWPQFKDLPYSEITSGFLQVLLKALHKSDRKLLKKYIKKLLESFLNQNDDDKNVLPQVFMSKPAIMLLEVVLQLAPPKLYTQMYAKCFVNNLATLAKMQSANFSVQKLLVHCGEKVEFEAMFDELSEHFTEIFEAGYSGVLLSFGQTCKRLQTRQGTFIQNMMKALECFEPQERQNEFVLCLSKLLSYENLQKTSNDDLEKAKLKLHGTLIVQLMLEFNKPIKIVNSILSLDTECLKKLFCNSMGSHIADSFMKSAFVGEKSREKLVKKLKGVYQDLAASKYGSWSFEAVWNVCSLKNKLVIMEELIYKEGSWSHSEIGKIIASKVNLELYKRNKEDWKNSVNKSEKVKLLLQVLD